MPVKMHVNQERAVAEAERLAALRRQARLRMLEAERLEELPRLTVRQIRAAGAEKAGRE